MSSHEGGIRGRIRRLFRRDDSKTPEPTAGSAYEPIEDYALIGDRITTALVSKTGSIDWVCFPRMDSPSVFARILDAKRGGYCAIRPVNQFESRRKYRESTAILETTFSTGTGEAVVIDFMPPQSAELERLGDSAIIRIVRGVTGRVQMRLSVHPAFDYGRQEHEWNVAPGMGARASTPDESLTVHSTRLQFQVDDHVAHGEFETQPGDEHIFIIRHRKPGAMMFHQQLRDLAPTALETTERYWRDWVARCTYQGPHEALVKQSAIMLRLLDYSVTGAIVAAPTTSLPETPGGIRNWDYRYCWIRDAAFTLYAFLLLGYPEEAETYLNWLLDVTRGHPDSLRVLYGIGGESEAPEFTLDHFEGYEGASPVRIGNGAWDQQQHDMYGEILDCAYLMHRNGGVISEGLWEMLRRAVDHACDIWKDPDQGPWEVRSAPRHFVYSKVLCWVAVDRGLRLAKECGFGCNLDRWTAVAEEIRKEVMEKGYKEHLGTFTAAYDGEDLDASILALPLRRFIEADDPRMVSTVERIREGLSFGNARHLLLRVPHGFEDGLHGDEGSFMLCNFWVVDCLVMQGKLDEAEQLFTKLESHANDLGLYAEMLEPDTGRQLGNFPQAFTHIALIVSAANLQRAREGKPAGEEAVTIAGN